jgi:tetratricopeptide (TPR) repeat protein
VTLATPAKAGSFDTRAAVKEGFELLDEWQLEDALALARPLLAEAPEDPAVWALAASVLHHRGEHATALALFDAARDAGVETPYNHALAAGSAAYAAHFSRLETPHFSIRYLNKDEIVAHYAAPVLEAAYRNIGTALGMLVAERGEKVVVEIYPDARGLTAATGLTMSDIANSGTIAVCKFHRLMITSPLAVADGYSWADTLAHEFTHLLISKKSRNNIPIWLHEGIAKYYESLWKGPAGAALEPYSEKLLADGLKSGKLVTFEQMHPSMAKLPTQEDAALAFAEVFTTIEFLRGRFGEKSIPEVLELCAGGATVEQALQRVFGMSLGGVENAWRRWVRKRKFVIVPGAKPERIVLAEGDGQGSSAKEKPLESMPDKDIHDFSRLGELLQLRGNDQAAVIEYEKATARAGLKYPTLTYRLARAYVAVRREREAMTLLDQSLAVFPDNSDSQLLAGRIRLQQNQTSEAKRHFEAVRLQNPFNPEIHAALAKLAELARDSTTAEREQRFLKLSSEPRPTRVYALPSPPAGNARASFITLGWDQLRIDGGTPRASPVWALPLNAGTHTVEFVGKGGAMRTETVTLAVGDDRRFVLE